MNKHNWTYKKLGEVATIVGGSTPKSNIEEFWGGTHYWVTPADLDGNKYQGATPRTITDLALQKTNLQLLPIGTVLLSSRAPIGKVAITTVPMFCNQGFKNVVCSDLLLNEFVYWYLLSKIEYLNSLGRGATFKEISKKTTEKIPIPVPPMEEQERIVAELDLLSGVIEKKKEQLKAYDQLAQSIFYSMFGDPITNEKGWEIKKLGEVCGYSDTRIKSEEITIDNYVGVENLLQDCKGRINANKVPEGLGLTEFAKGDVLLGNIRPYLKKIWLADIGGGCNGDVLVIRIKRDFIKWILPCYIFGCLSKDAFFDYDMHYSKGEKMPRGDKKEILKYPIVIPPLALQQEFAEKIEEIEAQKALIQQSIKETETLFNSRMDYYFN